MTGDNQVGNYAFTIDQPLKSEMLPLYWLHVRTLKSTMHGKVSEGIACWLPLFGDAILPLANHQDVSTSQRSDATLSLWLLFDFCPAFCLAMTLAGSALALAAAPPPSQHGVGGEHPPFRDLASGKGQCVPLAPAPAPSTWAAVTSRLPGMGLVGCYTEISGMRTTALLT